MFSSLKGYCVPIILACETLYRQNNMDAHGLLLAYICLPVCFHSLSRCGSDLVIVQFHAASFSIIGFHSDNVIVQLGMFALNLLSLTDLLEEQSVQFIMANSYSSSSLPYTLLHACIGTVINLFLYPTLNMDFPT